MSVPSSLFTVLSPQASILTRAFRAHCDVPHARLVPKEQQVAGAQLRQCGHALHEVGLLVRVAREGDALQGGSKGGRGGEGGSINPTESPTGRKILQRKPGGPPPCRRKVSQNGEGERNGCSALTMPTGGDTTRWGSHRPPRLRRTCEANAACMRPLQS